MVLFILKRPFVHCAATLCWVKWASSHWSGVVLFDAAWEHHAHVQVKESMGGKAGLGSLVVTDAYIGAQFVQFRWTSPQIHGLQMGIAQTVQDFLYWSPVLLGCCWLWLLWYFLLLASASLWRLSSWNTPLNSKPSSLHPLLTGLVPRQRLQDCTSAEGVKGCSSIFSRDLTEILFGAMKDFNRGENLPVESSIYQMAFDGNKWSNRQNAADMYHQTTALWSCSLSKTWWMRMWQLSATSTVLIETFAPWSISNSLPLDWVLFPPLLWKHCEKTTRNIQVSKRWRPDGLAAKVIIFANWRGFSGGTRLDTWMFFLGSGQWGGDTTMDGFFVFFQCVAS